MFEFKIKGNIMQTSDQNKIPEIISTNQYRNLLSYDFLYQLGIYDGSDNSPINLTIEKFFMELNPEPLSDNLISMVTFISNLAQDKLSTYLQGYFVPNSQYTTQFGQRYSSLNNLRLIIKDLQKDKWDHSIDKYRVRLVDRFNNTETFDRISILHFYQMFIYVWILWNNQISDKNYYRYNLFERTFLYCQISSTTILYLTAVYEFVYQINIDTIVSSQTDSHNHMTVLTPIIESVFKNSKTNVKRDLTNNWYIYHKRLGVQFLFLSIQLTDWYLYNNSNIDAVKLQMTFYRRRYFKRLTLSSEQWATIYEVPTILRNTKECMMRVLKQI